MSEFFKPWDLLLLAEITYSRRRAHASYFEKGRPTAVDKHVDIGGAGLSHESIRCSVSDALSRLFANHTCGIVIDPGVNEMTR